MTVFAERADRCSAGMVEGEMSQMQKELREYADLFDKAERFGSDQDAPEGARYIRVSDTLARQMSKDLRDFEREVSTHAEEARRQLSEQIAKAERALANGITSRRKVLADSLSTPEDGLDLLNRSNGKGA